MLTSKDIYREGAHNGVYMGLFLAVVSVLSFLSDRNSLLGIIAMPMLVCVPALHFSLLRSAYRKYGLDASFSALWMLGITIFVGASMICALATYCYLDFADPDFFYRTATAMMEIMKGRPEMAETYKTFKVMVDGGLLPRPGLVALVAAGVSIVVKEILYRYTVRQELQEERGGQETGVRVVFEREAEEFSG